MSEARLTTYIVGWDEGDFIMPIAATLTHARAEKIVEEVLDHLVEEGERRWKAMFEEDEEIRPYDPEDVRDRASERVAIAPWDVPFVGTEEAIDPHVFRLTIEFEEDHLDGELFRP